MILGGKLDCLASKLLCFSLFFGSFCGFNFLAWWHNLLFTLSHLGLYQILQFFSLCRSGWTQQRLGEGNGAWREAEMACLPTLYVSEDITPIQQSAVKWVSLARKVWICQNDAFTNKILQKSKVNSRNLGLFRPDSTKSNYILNKKIVITLPCYLCHGWRVRVDLHNRGTVLLKCHLWVTFSRDSHKMANPWRRGLLCPCLHWWLMWCYVGKITTICFITIAKGCNKCICESLCQITTFQYV